MTISYYRLITVMISFIFSFAVHTSAYSETKHIGILVFDGFLTSDVTAPMEVLGAASKKSWFSSYDVVVISTSRNKNVISEEGLNIVADYSIYDTPTLDVLLVPSAYNMDSLIKNDRLIEFISEQSQSTSWMASNCSGAFLLGKAGVLEGKAATTWAGGEKQLKKAFPNVDVRFNQNVVISDNIITSNGGPVSYQAAFALLTRLSTEKFSTEIAESIQFNRLASAFDNDGSLKLK